jgi:hypothetical protein
MASVKEAVAKAIEFAQSVLGPARTSDLRLEEVEKTKLNGDDAWSITLSMLEPQATPLEGTLSQQLTRVYGRGPREYKTFTVDSQTGNVLSMKIRELVGSD